MTDLDRGIAIFDAPAPVSADITPSDWYLDPRTGWPWLGLIARPGDDEAVALIRRRAASRVRILRHERRLWQARIKAGPADDYIAHGLRQARIDGIDEAIAILRGIFKRPAPRAGRSDLAGRPGGMPESRDGSVLPEAPVRALGASPTPAAPFPPTGRPESLAPPL